MPQLSTKVLYVKAQGQTRDHHCHWPGCAENVPPAKWGCSKHWFTLPKALRDRIWAAYVPGQEITATPNAQYVAVCCEAQIWIAQYETGKQPVASAPVDQVDDDLDIAKRVVAWLRGEPREQWEGLTKPTSAEAIERLIQRVEESA